MSGEAGPYYQAALDLRGRHCLVVGGGTVAQRKVEGLLEAGAVVTVVAPGGVVMPEGATVVSRAYADADLDDAAFVVAATDDPAVNAGIARSARERGVWVNVVDDPSAGTVIVPAVVRRGALRIAVSTGGASPALAQSLRRRLEDEFGEEYADLVGLLGELRAEWEPRAIAAGVPPAARRAAWHAVLDLPLLALMAQGRGGAARKAARQVLDDALRGERPGDTSPHA